VRFCILAELADKETWREVTERQNPRESLRFEDEAHAQEWLSANYPHTLNGWHVRPSVFHGLQRLRVARIEGT